MKFKKLAAEQLTTLACVGSVVLGIAVGAILRATTTMPWSARDVMYVNFPGELFLRMLKMLILPLITTSLMASIGTLDLKTSGRIGKRTIIYYAYTMLCAISTGIILVNTIRPGVGMASDSDEEEKSPIKSKNLTPDTLLDLVRNMFPANIVQACFAQFQTVIIDPSGNGTSGDYTYNT